MRFRGAGEIPGNQLFYGSEQAEEAAKRLNSGVAPEDINIREL